MKVSWFSAGNHTDSATRRASKANSCGKPANSPANERAGTQCAYLRFKKMEDEHGEMLFVLIKTAQSQEGGVCLSSPYISLKQGPAEGQILIADVPEQQREMEKPSAAGLNYFV